VLYASFDSCAAIIFLCAIFLRKISLASREARFDQQPPYSNSARIFSRSLAPHFAARVTGGETRAPAMLEERTTPAWGRGFVAAGSGITLPDSPRAGGSNAPSL
jgi:hypothetical protein